MKIGLLLPSSNQYPYMGVDFAQGMKYLLGSDCTWIEYETNNASPREIQNGARHLILKENVDLLTGWIGYKALPAIRPLIQQTQTPLIMCNAGEHPLLEADRSPYIVHCSLELFTSTFLACQWANRELGSPYASLLSFYDAGYPFLKASELATRNSKGSISRIEITHRDKDPGVQPALERILPEKPAYIFASSCGSQGLSTLQTLQQFTERLDLPLVGQPLLTDTKSLNQAGRGNIYSVNTWTQKNHRIRTELEHFFKSELHRELSVFGMLGYEAAAIITQCLEKNWQPRAEIGDLLNKTILESPRGELVFQHHNNHFEPRYTLCKTECNGKWENRAIREFILQEEDRQLLRSQTEEAHGWLNSYLCV